MRISPLTEKKTLKVLAATTAIKNVTTSNSGCEVELAFIELSNRLRIVSDFPLISLFNTADWRIATCYMFYMQSGDSADLEGGGGKHAHASICPPVRVIRAYCWLANLYLSLTCVLCQLTLQSHLAGKRCGAFAQKLAGKQGFQHPRRFPLVCHKCPHRRQAFRFHRENDHSTAAQMSACILQMRGHNRQKTEDGALANNPSFLSTHRRRV
jgi:hypothetical protein